MNCFKALLRCVWRYEISKSITIFCQKCPTSNTAMWLESWISTELLLMLARGGLPTSDSGATSDSWANLDNP